MTAGSGRARTTPPPRRASSTARSASLRGEVGVDSPRSSPARRSSKAPSTGSPSPPKAKRGTAEVDARTSWRNHREPGASRTGPQPRAAQSEALPARTELRRPAHHRPGDLPAHLRGRAASRTTGGCGALVNGDRIYPRLWPSCSRRPTPGTIPGCSTSSGSRAGTKTPDELTLEPSQVDDKLLREILRGLYYPDSPYRVLRPLRRHPGPGLRAVPGHRSSG
jgi:hypothetical protein